MALTAESILTTSKSWIDTGAMIKGDFVMNLSPRTTRSENEECRQLAWKSCFSILQFQLRSSRKDKSYNELFQREHSDDYQFNPIQARYLGCFIWRLDSQLMEGLTSIPRQILSQKQVQTIQVKTVGSDFENKDIYSLTTVSIGWIQAREVLHKK